MSENDFERILGEQTRSIEEDQISQAEKPYTELLEKTDAELAGAVRASLETRAQHARDAVAVRFAVERKGQMERLERIQRRVENIKDIAKLPAEAVGWPKDRFGRTRQEFIDEVAKTAGEFAEQEITTQLRDGRSLSEIDDSVREIFGVTGGIAKLSAGREMRYLFTEPRALSLDDVYSAAYQRIAPHKGDPNYDAAQSAMMKGGFIIALADGNGSAPEFLVRAKQIEKPDITPKDALAPHISLIEKSRLAVAERAHETDHDRMLGWFDTTMERYGYVYQEDEHRYLALPEQGQ